MNLISWLLFSTVCMQISKTLTRSKRYAQRDYVYTRLIVKLCFELNFLTRIVKLSSRDNVFRHESLKVARKWLKVV
jgi:hypothetical protein